MKDQIQSERGIILKLESFNDFLRKSVVSFDIDQVEANSAATALSRINSKLGSSFVPEDLVSYWSTIDLLESNFKNQVKNPQEFAVENWNHPSVILNALPVSGALILSKYLFDNGVNAYRITSRPSTLREVTLGWYQKYMPWVDRSRICIQAEGVEIRPDFKVDMIKKYKVTLHFEDSWEQAVEITKNTPAKVVLVPQPWNNNFIPGEGSNIIKIPPFLYPRLPKLIRVYMHLADLFY